MQDITGEGNRSFTQAIPTVAVQHGQRDYRAEQLSTCSGATPQAGLDSSGGNGLQVTHNSQYNQVLKVPTPSSQGFAELQQNVDFIERKDEKAGSAEEQKDLDDSIIEEAEKTIYQVDDILQQPESVSPQTSGYMGGLFHNHAAENKDQAEQTASSASDATSRYRLFNQTQRSRTNSIDNGSLLLQSYPWQGMVSDRCVIH